MPWVKNAALDDLDGQCDAMNLFRSAEKSPFFVMNSTLSRRASAAKLLAIARQRQTD